jgi:4-amino-4-deoxy-L-arabinose transferase-like glycosyltransferase
MVKLRVMPGPETTKAPAMQPYMGSDASTLPPADVEAAEDARDYRRVDLRNLLIILVGWTALLFIIPPRHEYPIIDDWIYAGSVRNILETGRFVMPDWSQANLVGLSYWGLIWSKLFGFSFTTLTNSTLVMSIAALFALYGIARSLKVPPWGALLGTGLLAFNPIFVHLSYSFMTDVPYLALALIATYCYIRGMQASRLETRNSNFVIVWFVIGGLACGWSFLIRQFALLVPATFLLCIAPSAIFEALKLRKWRWRPFLEIAVIGLVPGIFFGGWYLATRNTPPNYQQSLAALHNSAFILKEPWLRVISLRAMLALPVTAFFAWGALKLRPRRWWLVAVWAVVLVWGEQNLDLPNESWIEVYEPPFVLQAGPLTVPLSEEMYTFDAVGNIIRNDGIDFFEYTNQKVWTPEVWRMIWGLGLVLTALLLAKISDTFLDWAIERWKERQTRHSVPPPLLQPLTAFYLLGALTFLVTLAFPGSFFDRYILGFIPFFILFVVRGSRRWGRIGWTYSIAALVVLAAFTLIVKSDQVDHDNARWQAGHWLLARSGGLHGGFDWDNWIGSRNDAYQIADIKLDGYRAEQSFPYTCRLCGLQTRYVYAQSRVDMPPLP